MTTDFRALCVELIASWDADGCDWKPQHQARWETTVARARAALADGPAVPDGREPASVTGQPSDEELLETLDKATATFPPRHPEAEGLNVVEYALALELRKARAVLARWGTSNLAETRSSLGGMPTPVPADKGEVEELVVDELVKRLRTKAATEKANRCHYSAILLTRAANLLEQRHPTPVPVSERLPVGVEQALIKAECALSDIAEGEPEENEGDADACLQWAEQRAATALSRIRPVMRLHGILTSEWPPLPAHALPIPQQQENING